MTAAHYANEARRYAAYLRNHGDNRLYRIAAGANDGDLDWTRTLMEAVSCLGCHSLPNGPFQAITVHAYSVIGEWDAKTRAREIDDDQYRAVLAKAQEVERLVQAHGTVMDAYDPQRQIGLILDEWGTWWATEEGTNPAFLYQQNTMTDALVAAVHLDGFHRQAARLVMANLAQTVNVLQAVVLTDEETGALILTPTYHVFEMNKAHQDADALVTRVVDGPAAQEAGGRPFEMVSASASRAGNSALISLSNLDGEEPLTVVLDLRGAEVTALTGRLLAAGDKLAHNTAQQPDAVAPVALDVAEHERGAQVVLPPHSFATVALELA
ncbi:alpha-L-arabinofuranosidase C-terminal domain-containing protein [Propioniciclava coleopterorum]|uniref:alpha-L-arabinofuranosidase C-terminal domain-containing protein n=1 Tax=Propioniciclava coleopterorum TaxID=2714937 RepID=UPI001FE53087|nr:alpha-L-arabinofuranosidase C-terminal domain-containing protein [Propioniciclava coleopterorum]